jgi:hypothetical protein
MSQIIEQSGTGPAAHHIERGSNKSFGFVFTIFFAIVALWPVIKHRADPRWWALIVAAVFLITTLIKADLLDPLNTLWMKIGILLGKIMNPVFLSIMFFLIITPAAIVLRLVGKDLLSMKFQPDAKSYWVPRSVDHEDGMKNQF